ncbi:MAG TPA: LON peptidase substrate-binding domain-containing protein, partial [Gammaproteobacteria bacterium]|nr:LON peptidase substrate-binding domain-containing protein [Gammaproteobacteria bacterium]
MAENEHPDGEYIPQEEESGSSDLVSPDSLRPSTLHLLPLTDRPFFPAQNLPVVMEEAPWLETVEKIGEVPNHMAGLVLAQGDDPHDLEPSDFYTYGTLVRIHQPGRSDGKIQFIAEGLHRFRIVRWLSSKPPYLVQVEYPEERRGEESDEVKAYAMAIINTIKELIPLNPLYSEELKYFLNRFGPNEPSALTDFAAALTTAEKTDLQDVVETIPVLRRMEKVLVLLRK